MHLMGMAETLGDPTRDHTFDDEDFEVDISDQSLLD